MHGLQKTSFFFFWGGGGEGFIGGRRGVSSLRSGFFPTSQVSMGFFNFLEELEASSAFPIGMLSSMVET